MRRHVPVPTMLVLAFCNACCTSNVGVLYAEYQQFSLASARITPEETSPIRVNVGWDQGSLAIVRRRGDEGSDVPQAGEAVSIIAKTELGSEFALAPGDDPGDLLGADAYFISGTAAMVAAVEDGKKVSIESGGQPVTKLTTEGEPAERIKSALGVRVAALKNLRARIAEEQRRVDALLEKLAPADYEDVLAVLIQSGLADRGDSFDPSATPAEKLEWLKAMARAGDDEEDLARLRRFGDALEQL